MSSRIIEAKFQALDRMIRLLHKPNARTKVSSSDQLRELVQTQRISNPAGPSEENSERSSSRCEDRPRTARGSVSAHHSTTEPKPSPRTTVQEDRTQVVLQDAWNEIDAAVSGRAGAQQRVSKAVPNQQPALALREVLPHTNQVEHSQPPSPVDKTEPQACQKLSPRSTRPTTPWTQRCKTPDAAIKPGGRNWLEPAPPRPVTARHKTRKVAPQSNHSSSTRLRPDHDEPKPLSAETGSAIDEPSFYYLEVRLDHGAPLRGWHFCVTFTDLSIVPRPGVTIDNVPADDENCLLFPAVPWSRNRPGSAPHILRYFNPVHYFAHIRRPRELYGHCIRILVVSTVPVQRVVIDTLVHFLVDDGSSHAATTAQHQPSPSHRHEPSSRPRPREKLELVLPRATVHSTDGDCSPWQAEDENSGIESDSPRHGSSPPRSPCSTMDKKKMELSQLRATMRRKLREERQNLRIR